MDPFESACLPMNASLRGLLFCAGATKLLVFLSFELCFLFIVNVTTYETN